MEIRTATLLYFSPTGGTKKVVRAIALGMGVTIAQAIDLTNPRARAACAAPGAPLTIAGEIILIGVPVYGRGVPTLVTPSLARLRADGRPAVLVTVYGGLSEGTALGELRVLAERAGLQVIAAGTFIGEHTLSTAGTPIAPHRPNAADLEQAAAFGQRIIEKLTAVDRSDKAVLKAPTPLRHWIDSLTPRMRGALMRQNAVQIFTQTPRADMDRCSRCGICAARCPMAAIDPATLGIDASRCMHCFGCVKGCPRKARSIVYRPKALVERALAAKGQEEPEPKIYL